MSSWIWRAPPGPAERVEQLLGLLARQRARGAGRRTPTIDRVSDELAALGEAAVPALLERLEAVGNPACVALARIGEPALPGVIAALTSGSRERRVLLLRTLGLSGLAGAVAPLHEALDDSDPDVRAAARHALERQAKIWTRRLRDGSRRDEAMRILAALGEPAAWPVAELLRDVRLGLFAAQVLGQIGAPAVTPVILVLVEARRSLTTDGEPVFSYAASALAGIGAPAVDQLTYLLYDRRESPAVRSGAAIALGRLGAAALPALLDALQVNDVFVRMCAASALGDVRGPAASAALEAALADPDGGVRAAVTAALGRLGR